MAAPQRRYHQAPDLRVRPVEQAGSLMVFTPARPKVHWLNLAGWYLFALCEDAAGAAGEDVTAAYADAVADRVPRDQAVAEAGDYLADLVERGILVHR